MRRLPAACLALFLALPAAEAGWQELAPLPEANGGFACGFIGGRLVIAGGTNWVDGRKHWLDAIRSYDPGTGSWSSNIRLPHAWAYGVCSVIHDRLVLAGGTDGINGLREILALDGEGKGEVIGELSTGQVYACGGLCGSRLILAGGAPGPGDLGVLTSRVAAINFSVPELAARVQPLPDLPGPGFGIAIAASVGDRLVIAGGARSDPTDTVRNLDDVRVLDARTGAVLSTLHLPGVVRGLAAVTLDHGLVYLAGGYPDDAQGFTDHAWVLDPAAGTIKAATPLPLTAMVHLLREEGWVYLLGGEDQKQHRSARMWRIAVSELVPLPR